MTTDYPQRLADQVVIEIKVEMIRCGIDSNNELGRRMKELGAKGESQYINDRLEGGRKGGVRTPLHIRDLAAIALVLGVPPHELIRRAEDELQRAERRSA